MGVQGLTPFLQKTFPDVIQQLPDRLRALAGKKIVIDGTLITQRLHFAQAPHPYRHIIGWYRIAREVEESGVSAICVFDGKERNAAKAREVQRRRDVRRLATSRGTLENDRFKRLQGLKSALNSLHGLDVVERQGVSALLQRIESENPVEDPSEFFQEQRTVTRASEVPQESNLQTVTRKESPPSPSTPLHTELSISEIMSDDGPSIQRPITPISPTVINIQDREFPTALEPPSSSISQDLTNDVETQLASLYLSYKDSVSKLASLPTPLESETSKADEAAVEQVMTKTQYQLAIDEGELWQNLTLSPCALPDLLNDDKIFVSSLDTLMEKSCLISESYQRRINVPTAQTYDECKEILQAMGVPCVESTGAFEAEALAAAMVLNGLADYVVSEDTDVLIYEAPMIRNISNQKDPLTIVSGAHVRTTLELTRESFVDFALLLGTDFSQRIKNVGPARAYRFIKEYGTIERIIETQTKYPPKISTKAYLDQVKTARRVFRTLPPVPQLELLHQDKKDEASINLIFQRYGLGRYLMVTDDWDYEEALAGNYFDDNPSVL